MNDADGHTRGEEQRARVGALRRTYEVLRAETGVPDLSASWVQVFLVIAEHPGQTLAWIEREAGLRTTSTHRAVVGLGSADRAGKTGLGLIESLPDPRHASRNLFFVSDRGRSIIAEMLSVSTGETATEFAVLTAAEYLTKFKIEQAAQPSRVDTKAVSPQDLSNAKRSLARSETPVGPHIVAFALAPAMPAIDEIRDWVEKQNGGKLHVVPTVAKPNGVAIADFPIASLQVAFHLRWRGPIQDDDLL